MKKFECPGPKLFDIMGFRIVEFRLLELVIIGPLKLNLGNGESL